MLKKIITCGRYGVERAALDAYLSQGVFFENKGREREQYQEDVLEDDEDAVLLSMEENVLEANGTLILSVGGLTSSEKQVAIYAQKHNKPCLIILLGNLGSVAQVVEWCHLHNITVLNVAGPLESECPGIYALSFTFMQSVLRQLTSFA